MVAALLGINHYIVPNRSPQLNRVAGNYEAFDGLDMPSENPGQLNPGTRPGMAETPIVNTMSPHNGLTNTLGGMPLPVSDWKFRFNGKYTPAHAPSIQSRIGAGQNNPSLQHTVFMSEITGAPPIPGDLTGIIAGYG